MQTNKENKIVDLSRAFALNIIEYCELLESKKKFNMANQLFRSGTSIGANVREAQNGESKADFIHKMKVAAKEADETEYWLGLCNDSKNYPNTAELLNQIESINQTSNFLIDISQTSIKSN